MQLLNRESLLKRDELKIQKVNLTENEFVYVRQMTGRERDNFERSLMREFKNAKGQTDYEKNLGDFRAKLAVNTLCDEDGEMLLKPDDYETLSKNMSAFKLEKIVNESQKLNSITEEDKEELVKNSTADLSDDSTSDSA